MKYDEVFSFKNLYLAHLKSRKCKRHKKDVILFELDLGNNIWKLKKKLDKRIYNISGYYHFNIYEPKERKIEAMYYEDRVVQHCLVDNYLMPILEKRLIYDNGACRINKGTDFCRKRVKMFLTKYYHKFKNNGYILQFDIHHYFESIKHDVLINKLNGIIEDLDLLSLLIKIINSYSDRDNSGLPIGNQTSQCFGLYYLDVIDRLIKEKYRIKYYSRYMDDEIIICNDKQKLRNLFNDIKNECNKIGLKLNDKKSRIYKLKEGFTYLDFRYNLLETGKILMKMPSDKRRKIERYLDSLNGNGIDERLVFYRDYLLKGNNYFFYEKINKRFEIKENI